MAAFRSGSGWSSRNGETASPFMPSSDVVLSAASAPSSSKTPGQLLRSRFAMFFLVLTAASAENTTTSPSKTLRQVIDGYTAAVGGKAALDAISNWQITGKPLDAGP